MKNEILLKTQAKITYPGKQTTCAVLLYPGYKGTICIKFEGHGGGWAAFDIAYMDSDVLTVDGGQNCDCVNLREVQAELREMVRNHVTNKLSAVQAVTGGNK